MKKILVCSLVSLATLGAIAQTKKTAPKAAPKTAAKPAASVKPLKTQNDSLSYAFGISLGEFLRSQGVTNISYPMLNLAISQSIKGQTTYLDPAQSNMIIGKIGDEKRHKMASAQKEESQKFLATNKTKQGINVTPSGLQYEILTKGTGPIPSLSDTIKAHYRGTLMNGKEFDNSYSRGEPLSIPVSGVIPGWTEALQLMPVGSKWKLYIPSDLAYGEYGAGSDIPGGAALIFEIELLGISGK